MIAIYEPLYRPGQQLVESAFLPLVIENNAHWREFHILIEMYRRGLHRQHSFTGLMSPKFGIKTGISGAEFIEFVRANADADVCFINPFPQLAYISFNVWMQGENSHPGLTSRAQELLKVCGVDLNLTDSRHNPATLCYCNFWVGTERFWEDYVGGILMPIAEFLERNPDHPASRSVLAETLHIDPAPFLPFIVERMFTSFLSRPPRPISARGFALDPLQACMHDFEREVVMHLKGKTDAADRAGHFPDEIRDNQALLSKLWQKYNTAYFENRPHPHSGKAFGDR